MKIAFIVGNLGKDATFEQVGVGGNNPLTKFSIASTKRWKTRSGERQEKTEWTNIVLWGKLGEAIHPYLTKGTKVAVVGDIETRQYEDKEGVMRYVTDVVAKEVELLGGGRRQDNEGSQGEEGGGEKQDAGDFEFGDVP